MGRTGNMIIKDFLRQMCVPLENSAYFGDGDGFNSNPACDAYIAYMCQWTGSPKSCLTNPKMCLSHVPQFTIL